MFKNHRWFVVVILFLAMLINYLDRSALSIAAPLLSKEFNLSPSEMGMVFSSFFVGYSIFNLIGGYIADKYGARIVLACSMLLWSLFCGLTTLATGLTSLLVIRFFFGVGEGPIAAATNKLVYNWFPTSERTRAMSYALAGVPLGSAISGPIVGMLTTSFGWKPAFWILVGFGILWTILFFNKVTETPATSKHIDAIELQEITTGQKMKMVDTVADSDDESLPWNYYLKKPIVLAAGIGYFAHSYVLFFFLSWFPSYLVQAKGLSLKEMSFATVVPWLVGTMGFVFGGHIAEYVLKKTGNVYLTRKLTTVVSSLVVALCVAVAGIVETTLSALILSGIALFAMYVAIPNFWGIVQDNVHGKQVGLVGGFIHFISNISGVIAPFITGMIVQKTGGFVGSFLVAAGVTLLGAVILFLFIRPEKKSVATN